MDGPDIARGWDLLADAYQREVGWPDETLAWGLRCPDEAQLELISDVVREADVLVLGCGGGQDLLALARLGAGSLIGIDPSARQLEHARRRVDDSGVPALLHRCPAQSLAPIADASIDLVVAVQALDYVDDTEACFQEIARVLRPGGVLAFSVLHPADLATADEPPYGWHTPYFEPQRDWIWDGLAEVDVPLRSWSRSPSAWFTAVTASGLVVERLLEPEPTDAGPWIDRGWLDETSAAKLDVVPGTIVLRARLPDLH